MKAHSTLFGFFLFLSVSSATAQQAFLWKEKPGTWSITAGAGTTRYAGDMNELWDVQHLRLGAAVSASVNYRFSYHFSVRGEARLYYIYGSHKHTRIAYNNLSFSSLNPDAWVGLQADILPIDANIAAIPYVFAGTGATYMTPKARYGGKLVSLAPLHTEGKAYNRLAGIITYGAGLPLIINQQNKVRLELSYTHVMNDYLDDVSTVYPDFSKLTPLGAALSDRRTEIGLEPNRPGNQRGHASARDGYFVASVRYMHVLRSNRAYRHTSRLRKPLFRSR